MKITVESCTHARSIIRTGIHYRIRMNILDPALGLILGEEGTRNHKNSAFLTIRHLNMKTITF